MQPRVIVIDNYDSFTWNLVQSLEELGATCDVRASDRTSARDIASALPHGVVLSPGPGRPEDAGETLEVVAGLGPEIPLLGVCLGHQAIGQAFGASVRKAASPVHGRVTPITHHGTGLFEGIPSPFAGARYHSLSLDRQELPHCLEVSALADDGEIMAISHRTLRIHGIQFHPESFLTEHGKTLLANWVDSLRPSPRMVRTEAPVESR